LPGALRQRAEAGPGDESELCGFASFDPQRVLCKISELLLGGGYPALVQTVVLRKE